MTYHRYWRKRNTMADAAMNQIRAILDATPEINAAELRLAVNEHIKEQNKKTRTNKVQKMMREFVTENKKLSLARLRKELKLAYAAIHNDDDSTDASSPTSAYRQFVKDQSALLKNDIAFMFSDQRERMVEIGKRWKAQKIQTGSLSLPESVPESESPPPAHTTAPTQVPKPKKKKNTNDTNANVMIGPPAARRITRSTTHVDA